jgi:hypothetical protein
VAVEQYTFTKKQYTEYRERNILTNKKFKHTYTTVKKLTNLGSAGHAPSLRVIPWHIPYKLGKSRGFWKLKEALRSYCVENSLLESNCGSVVR